VRELNVLLNHVISGSLGREDGYRLQQVRERKKGRSFILGEEAMCAVEEESSPTQERFPETNPEAEKSQERTARFRRRENEG